MPTLDVSAALLCPEFTDFVTVRRRLEEVNEYGEVAISEQPIYGVPVVVTATESNELVRSDGSQYQARTHTVVSIFAFRGPSPKGQPDIVDFMGTTFLVDKVEPYSRYASGFVQARMTSTPHIDPAPSS